MRPGAVGVVVRIGRLAALGLLLGATAQAEPVDRPIAEAGTALYVDDLDTIIVSPRARAGVTLPAEVEVGVSWTADIISSASVDVVTSATRMRDVRHEIGAAVRRQNLVRELDADVLYAYSIERDAYAHTVQGGLRLSLLGRNLELAARVGTSFTRLGEVSQSVDLWKSLSVHDVELAATVLLDRRTTAELVVSGYSSRGMQASPYRRVPLVTSRDLRDADWLPESVPHLRLRGAATLRLRRALGRRWILAGEYRLYGDDWGIVAHTEELEASLALTPRVSLRAHERGSVQNRARFYRATYASAARELTRDRRLAPSESVAAGLALHWDLGPLAGAEPFALLLAVDGIAWHYSEFLAPWPSFSAGTELRPLRWVHGLIGQLGLSAAW